MDYKAPLETYSGQVKEIVLGKGDGAVKIGGENILPLHYFEGATENKPRIALEVYDSVPENWAGSVMSQYKDVVADPVAWAKKCRELGADLICLRLISTDPAGANGSADDAVATAKKVVDAVDVPVIVYGTGDEAKDVDVLVKVAEVCDGAGLLLGPVLKENFEPIGQAALDHGHSVIAQTPVDINLEKELNVKLLKFLPPERIVIDPLSSALGYGMEYSFTIMERTKQIGIVFGDATMQMPIIADLANEAWKTKQAREEEEQGIMWESITGISLLLAGANILVLRHPESCTLMKEVIEGKL